MHPIWDAIWDPIWHTIWNPSYGIPYGIQARTQGHNARLGQGPLWGPGDRAHFGTGPGLGPYIQDHGSHMDPILDLIWDPSTFSLTCFTMSHRARALRRGSAALPDHKLGEIPGTKATP